MLKVQSPMIGFCHPGEIYFENTSKYYLKSSLNKLRIALHSILRKDFVVFSKSQNHLGNDWATTLLNYSNCNELQVIKFLVCTIF